MLASYAGLVPTVNIELFDEVWYATHQPALVRATPA
jgi:hypothetical protein